MGDGCKFHVNLAGYTQKNSQANLIRNPTTISTPLVQVVVSELEWVVAQALQCYGFAPPCGTSHALVVEGTRIKVS